MIVTVPVSIRSYIFFISRYWRSGWMRQRIFSPVVLKYLLLHGLGECIDGVAGLLGKRGPVHAHRVSVDLHRAFRSRENQRFAFFAAVDEIDAQAEIEAFPIVEEPEHHVGSVTPIFPETQSSRCHTSRGAVGSGDEMSSAEQVNEQVARYSGTVSFPFPPLKEVLGIERNLWRRAQKTRPVTSLGRGVERNRVVPGAH